MNIRGDFYLKIMLLCGGHVMSCKLSYRKSYRLMKIISKKVSMLEEAFIGDPLLKLITMNHKVFVSFRGEQIRTTFLSHLCTSLQRKGITTFTASEFSQVSSLQALQDSLVAIPVISKDHASLNLWVDELANIIECEKKGTLTTLPIFFQLDPSDISSMLRNAGKNAHTMPEIQRKTLEDVKKWLDAHVINNSGFYSLDCTDDSELVAKVTTFISNIMESSSSSYETSTDLVPVRSLKLADMFKLDPIVKTEEPLLWKLHDNSSRTWCLKELRSLILCAKSTVLGICGIEGVGKTSLVRQVYNEITPQFQHHVFISFKFRPHYNSYRSKSLVTALACEALKGSSFHGKSDDFIKDMIRHRKVLLVADGVDNIKHIKGIIKDANWFARGSRIIVITQDRSLLTQCGVTDIYELECPKHEEALAFFSKFAFKRKKPLPGFEALSFRAVKVSNRLPLALKILGSVLCDKEKDEWESTLSRLEASHDNYATEVCRYIGADEYVPRRTIKVDNHIRVDEANRFPYYRFALK